MPAPALIGLDLGGTKCAVAVPDGPAGVREVARFPTAGPAATWERLRAEIAALRPPADVVFGISCGGPLDAARGVILGPPNLPGWDEVPLVEQLTREFGGRAFLMNDANASALAEWQHGAGRGARHLVFLTLGTGLGAGLILDGRLYEGATGSAGEVGHVRLAPTGPVGFGKAGSFEGFCSGGGLARLARARLATHPGESLLQQLPLDHLDARELARAAAAGDAFALSVWQEVGTRLGEGLALLVDLLNPDRIVLGGIYPRCQPLLEPPLRAALEREALPGPAAACQIVPAALGEQIGSHAALAAARYHLKPPPP